jgi:hypothetical protein
MRDEGSRAVEGRGKKCACRNQSWNEMRKFSSSGTIGGWESKGEGEPKESGSMKWRFSVIQFGFIEWKLQWHFCSFQSFSSDPH